VLLWGDSLAAHYSLGLSEQLEGSAHLMQATEPACMATLSDQGPIACRNFAQQMRSFFRDHRPDLVLISGDWPEYARPPKFDGMIGDLKNTIAALEGAGIRVIVLGPAIQFKSRLPSILVRAHLRGVDPRPDDVLLPDIFDLDQKMKSMLSSTDRFSYVSVLDAVCPNRQCPLTLAGAIPIAFDHAHLTAEGSRYVVEKLVPKLGLKGGSGG